MCSSDLEFRMRARRLREARRLVIKVGSALLVDGRSGRLNRSWLESLAADIKAAASRGQQVIVVSSGAIALGRRHLGLPAEERMAVQFKQGRAIFGVDMKIVDPAGKELPFDGKSSGDLLVRGPWVLNGYFKGEGGSPLADGWFPKIGRAHV